MRFSLKQLLVFVGISACIFAACRFLADSLKSEVRKEFEQSYIWYDDAVGVVERTSDRSGDQIVPTWRLESVTPGTGNLIHLSYTKFAKEFERGGPNYDVAIQLPAELKKGARIDLVSITKQHDSLNKSARHPQQAMQPGEMIIRKFSNPILSHLMEATPFPIGFVEIIELTPTDAVVRVSIETELTFGEFRFNQECRLNRLDCPPENPFRY